jgi:predicted aspartyl protease
VTVRSPASGQSIANVSMLIDTGADVTLLPRQVIAPLIDVGQLQQQYELEAFDGTKSWSPVVRLELQFLGKTFRGQFLLVDDRHGVLGRNVLNQVKLLLDGPAQSWEEQR